MSTWTELSNKPKENVNYNMNLNDNRSLKEKVINTKPNVFVRFFQRLQTQRLAEAERLINNRMKYWK